MCNGELQVVIGVTMTRDGKKIITENCIFVIN